MVTVRTNPMDKPPTSGLHPDECYCPECVHSLEVLGAARDALVQLGTDHRHFDTADGDTWAVPPVQYPLLTQLRDASSHSAGNGSVGRSLAGVPFDVVASEMFTEIERALRVDAAACGAVDAGALTAIECAQFLLAHVGEQAVGWVAEHGAVWAGFVARIRGHLNPVRCTPLAGRCPVEDCGQWTHLVQDAEGQTVGQHALRVVWAGEEPSCIECACCGARWSRAQFVEMAEYLNPGALLRISGFPV